MSERMCEDQNPARRGQKLGMSDLSYQSNQWTALWPLFDINEQR